LVVRFVCVPLCVRVFRVCPGSPRCLFTGSPRCLFTGTGTRYKGRRLFDTGRDILRAQRATKLRRAAAPSGAAGAAWRRAAPP
jgi:hypothetical protein